MNWYKRGIGDEIAIRRKECTREVESLFDVRADGCLLQRPTHGLRHAHEAVGEEREEDGVRCGLVRHDGVLALVGMKWYSSDRVQFFRLRDKIVAYRRTFPHNLLRANG